MFAKSLMALALAVAVSGCGFTPVNEGDGGTGGGKGGGGGSAGGGAGGGSASCSPACGSSRSCCGGACVNTANDPNNCGGCGVHCTGTAPYCDGTCQPMPCMIYGGSCPATSCCGYYCCAEGQLCCLTEGPVAGSPSCFTPTSTDPTCPQGCAPLCVSDRNLKRQIVPADEQVVLESLASMPISTWSYKSDNQSVRHLGPMAQDFRAAFGLGNSPEAYDPLDAHGVELAAIKALTARLHQLEAENRKLEERLEALESPRAVRRPARR